MCVGGGGGGEYFFYHELYVNLVLNKHLIIIIIIIIIIISHLTPPENEIQFHGKSVRSCCDGSSDRSFMMDPLSHFSFQPVLHDWCNKDHGMSSSMYDDAYKKILLLIGKSIPCGGSGFPLSLSEWSVTICLTPYNCK